MHERRARRASRECFFFGDECQITYSDSHESEWRMIDTTLVLYVILRVQGTRARVIMVRVLNTRGRVNTLNKNLLGLYCTWVS